MSFPDKGVGGYPDPADGLHCPQNRPASVPISPRHPRPASHRQRRPSVRGSASADRWVRHISTVRIESASQATGSHGTEADRVQLADGVQPLRRRFLKTAPDAARTAACDTFKLLASEELSTWQELFLALPPRGEHTLVGAIAEQLGRDPEDVFESLVHSKTLGRDRAGGKVLFHLSNKSASAPAASVRIWLSEAGEDEQRKVRGAP
jgi:hypothetical protein